MYSRILSMLKTAGEKKRMLLKRQIVFTMVESIRLFNQDGIMQSSTKINLWVIVMLVMVLATVDGPNWHECQPRDNPIREFSRCSQSLGSCP